MDVGRKQSSTTSHMTVGVTVYTVPTAASTSKLPILKRKLAVTFVTHMRTRKRNSSSALLHEANADYVPNRCAMLCSTCCLCESAQRHEGDGEIGRKAACILDFAERYVPAALLPITAGYETG
jgi:hypothetical protein